MEQKIEKSQYRIEEKNSKNNELRVVRLFVVFLAIVGMQLTDVSKSYAASVNKATSFEKAMPILSRMMSSVQMMYLKKIFGIYKIEHSDLIVSRRSRGSMITEWKLPEDLRKETIDAGDPIPSYFRYEEMWHTVQRRDDAERLRNMYKYHAGDLERLNPSLDLEGLKEGDIVKVWERTDLPSESRGRANGGRLVNGEPLRPTDSFILLYRHRDFGTSRTVATIQSVLDDFSSHFPEVYPLIIGDIGFRSGRHIAPHHSHQSGRDVDISYPELTAPRSYRRFTRPRLREFRAKETLWLLKRFIDSGYVEYIFVDRRLQRRLVEEAEREGAPQEWINAVFKYHGSPRAIVRHARGHINHFHVRFRCTISDVACHDSIRDREREEARMNLREKDEGGEKEDEVEWTFTEEDLRRYEMERKNSRLPILEDPR